MNQRNAEIINIIRGACSQFSPSWSVDATERLSNGSSGNPATSVIIRTNMLTLSGALVEICAESGSSEIHVTATHAGENVFFESYDTIRDLRSRIFNELRSMAERLDGPCNEISILYSIIQQLVKTVDRLDSEVNTLTARIRELEDR